MKKFTVILLTITLLFSYTLPICAAENEKSTMNLEAYVLDSFSGEQLDPVSNVNITTTDISFNYSGHSFFFPLSKLNIDTSDGNNISGAKFYSGKAGDLSCNIVEYNHSYCVQVLNTSDNISSRKADCDNNFTVIIGKKAKENEQELSVSLNTQNQLVERKLAVSSSGHLHVYTSGLNVPFLISSGSSEGWCTATIRESNNYQVSSLSYSVAYNWPSDGVSLWYDYINSVSAYHSPAWPSSQLTNVSGTWTINKGTGAFMAETTVSALVKGFPLMWSLYDVSYMDGTHQ
jgi:hypothetical protein